MDGMEWDGGRRGEERSGGEESGGEDGMGRKGKKGLLSPFEEKVLLGAGLRSEWKAVEERGDE